MALYAKLAREHMGFLDETLVIDELGLCGEVRVDVAVLNGAMTGFELKSAKDTLRRLPKQVEVYSRVLDYAELVVADKHLAAASAILPSWWGITVAHQRGTEEVHLSPERDCQWNINVDPLSLAQLLWRDEVLDELVAHAADRGFRNKPRNVLWQRLTEVIDLPELRDVVRNRLKARATWRAGALSGQYAEASPTVAR